MNALWSINFLYKNSVGDFIQREIFKNNELDALKVSANIKEKIESLGLLFCWSCVQEVTDELESLDDFLYDELTVH